MNALAISAIVLVLTTGAGLFGIWLRLAESHISTDSRDVVKAVMGLIATMSALILSLLIASAKANYDVQAAELQTVAAKLLILDGALAQYGPEAAGARATLRRNVEVVIDRVWAPHSSGGPVLIPEVDRGLAGALLAQIRALRPVTEMQKEALAEAQAQLSPITQTRMLMFTQVGNAISPPFLIILVSWLVILLFGFGLFAQPNPVVIAALLLGSLSVASAIFLILELDNPYSGLLHIPDTALRNTLALMARP